MRTAHGGRKSNTVRFHIQSDKRMLPALDLINIGLILDHLGTAGHRSVVDIGLESMREGLRVICLDVLEHGRRISQ